jgi:hypothetical protein
VLVGSGKFTGVNGHEMRGAFRFVRNDTGYFLEIYDDFFFDAMVPAPVLALGDISGKHIRGSNFQLLQPFTEMNGNQCLLVDTDAVSSSVESVIAWCAVLRIELGFGLIRRGNNLNPSSVLPRWTEVKKSLIDL